MVEIIEECPDVITLTFNAKDVDSINYTVPKPGQFIMVWVPGVDEVPMSISGVDKNGNWSITVKKVGECTKAIYELRVGDYIGIRGPLGNWFILPENSLTKCFLVGGSIGMAPLKFLALQLLKKNQPISIIQGAKNKGELIFRSTFDKMNAKLTSSTYCTDDGSIGMAALAPELFKSLLLKENHANTENLLVYTCGPEKMIYQVFELCEKRKIALQASLERVMRCGCGLCGLCAIDPLGLLVCKDGPVFSSETLRQMEDFGKFKRDFTGKKIILD